MCAAGVWSLRWQHQLQVTRSVPQVLAQLCLQAQAWEWDLALIWVHLQVWVQIWRLVGAAEAALAWLWRRLPASAAAVADAVGHCSSLALCCEEVQALWLGCCCWQMAALLKTSLQGLRQCP